MNTLDLTTDPASRKRAIKEAWISYPDANAIVAVLEELLKEDKEIRPRCLAIIGEANYGKSHLVTRFAERHTTAYDPNVDSPVQPVLCVELPGDCTPAAFLRTLIHGTGAPVNLREPNDEMMRRLCLLIKELQTKLVLIDEFHNGFKGTHRQQMIMLNLTRELSNRTRIPMAVAGIEDVDHFIRNDSQLDQRFRRIHLGSWKEDDQTRRLLKTFEDHFQLKNPSRLASLAMTKKIVELTEGKLGRISFLLKACAVEAINDGSELITEALLVTMSKKLPASDASLTMAAAM